MVDRVRGKHVYKSRECSCSVLMRMHGSREGRENGASYILSLIDFLKCCTLTKRLLIKRGGFTLKGGHYFKSQRVVLGHSCTVNTVQFLNFI
jgi:hypothetical protein